MSNWIIGAGVCGLIALLLAAAVTNRRRLNLSINEIATLTLSVTSVFVAVLAYLQTLDSSDMRRAIGQLTYLGKQTYRQANATRRHVRELAAQTVEMKYQTEELRKFANSSVSMAGSAVAELEQRDNQFSLEQRPLIRWDANSIASKNPFWDDRINGLLYWNYGLRMQERV